MTRTNPTRIGRRIVALRAYRGMSQPELVARVGIAQQSLSLIENGKIKRFEGEVLVKLAKALNTTTDFILTGEGGLTEDTEDDSRRTLAGTTTR